jgi:hypothetical protein
MTHPWKEQAFVGGDGRRHLHRERPSKCLAPCKMTGEVSEFGEGWENDLYYGNLTRHKEGFAVGGGPWALISISRLDETATHDWRHYQQIKNDLVGEEWEAVEIYPAESRLKDPSNRFYLWCAPRGVFNFGMMEGRLVLDIGEAIAPQRPLPEGGKK